MSNCTCGTEIDSDRAASELCAACLLRLALEPRVISGSSDEAPVRILGPVGRGPHGTVYLAARPDDDPQLVTVKVIEAATDARLFCQRLTSTAVLLDALRHPCIPELLHVATTASGQPYVMATYIRGPSLRDFIQARKVDVADRAILAGRLCSAVADLHEREIVHGSLKATNVIVLESANGPMPLLLDTGIVPAIEHGAGGPGVTSEARDERDLHALIGLVLGDLAGLVEGTEPAAVLADMFAPRPDRA